MFRQKDIKDIFSFLDRKTLKEHVLLFKTERHKEHILFFRQKRHKEHNFKVRATKEQILKDRGTDSLCLKRNRTKNMNDHELPTNYS